MVELERSLIILNSNNSKRDITAHAESIENCIRLLSAEIYRMSKLPYASKENRDKILYLDELLAAYERDAKKSI